jgi:hypothetical protein
MFLTIAIFALSALFAIAAFLPIFNKTPFSMVSLLGMATAVFLIGLQRTRRFCINQHKFKNSMRFLYLVLFLGAVGNIIYASFI